MEISREIMGQLVVKVQQGINTRKLLWQNLIACKDANVLDKYLQCGMDTGLLSKTDEGKFTYTGMTLDYAMVLLATVGTKVKVEDVKVPKTVSIRVDGEANPKSHKPIIRAEIKTLEKPYNKTVLRLARSVAETKKVFTLDDIREQANKEGYSKNGLVERIVSAINYLAKKDEEGKRHLIPLGNRTYRLPGGHEIPDEIVERKHVKSYTHIASKQKLLIEWAEKLNRPFSLADANDAMLEFGYTQLDKSTNKISVMLSYLTNRSPQKSISRLAYGGTHRRTYVASIHLDKFKDYSPQDLNDLEPIRVDPAKVDTEVEQASIVTEVSEEKKLLEKTTRLLKQAEDLLVQSKRMFQEAAILLVQVEGSI